jgi:hypothetical protein
MAYFTIVSPNLLGMAKEKTLRIKVWFSITNTVQFPNTTYPDIRINIHNTVASYFSPTFIYFLIT